MWRVRKSSDRGRTQTHWLNSSHSFSFGHYYDPEQMGVSVLRVINEDRVAPVTGFGEHGHRDMEIITYVLSGALKHKDSMGHEGIIRAGDIQLMSAGTGIFHSEMNASDTDPVHFLQIWIIPDQQGLTPNYQQETPLAEAAALTLLASPSGTDKALTINQNAFLYLGKVSDGVPIRQQLKLDRTYWLQVIEGNLSLNDSIELSEGDGAAGQEEQRVSITTTQTASFLLFDLPQQL